jgi:hypothetical protein
MRTTATDLQSSLIANSTANLTIAHTAIIVTLVSWVSASIFLDLLIMPGLYITGMMANPGFVMAGDLIFSVFNRLELVAGALVLTGALLWQTTTPQSPLSKTAMMTASLLLLIPLIYTYGLTPHMSGLGIQLSLFETPQVPETMDQLHYAYWSLEILKLAASGFFLTWIWQRPPAAIAP